MLVNPISTLILHSYVRIPYSGKLSWGLIFAMANLQSFRGLIFADTCVHAHYALHNRTYFAGLIFADSCLSAKTTKIRPHENFPLYGSTKMGLGY